MSSVSSPTRFTGVEDHFCDHINIAEKMKVPKRIKLSGDHDDIESAPRANPWDEEKFDMKVPERIVVVGQDQYCGGTAPPIEIRVQTPPRVITLNDHCFPTVEDEQETNSSFSPVSTDIVNANSLSYPQTVKLSNQWPSVTNLGGSGGDKHKALTISEELSHLRMQMAKLNRRLLAMELDNNQRHQREKTMVVLGLGYFIVKFLMWLNK